jgi:hypothetical protein
VVRLLRRDPGRRRGTRTGTSAAADTGAVQPIPDPRTNGTAIHARTVVFRTAVLGTRVLGTRVVGTSVVGAAGSPVVTHTRPVASDDAVHGGITVGQAGIVVGRALSWPDRPGSLGPGTGRVRGRLC